MKRIKKFGPRYGMKRFDEGGEVPAEGISGTAGESGTAGGGRKRSIDDMSFSEAFKLKRRELGGGKTFTWRGDKYTTELDKEKPKESKASDKDEDEAPRKPSGPTSRYPTGPAAVEKRRQAEYAARNPQYSEREPGAESVSPEEILLGPKAKAAAGAAAATAAGYGLKKARDFLMRKGAQTRAQSADVLKGSGAMSRSAAARDAEAAAYAERIKNARRSPGMTGYKSGGSVKRYAAGGSVSSASRRADGIASKGKTRCKIV